MLLILLLIVFAVVGGLTLSPLLWLLIILAVLIAIFVGNGRF